jgi:hypothetical protein
MTPACPGQFHYAKQRKLPAQHLKAVQNADSVRSRHHSIADISAPRSSSSALGSPGLLTWSENSCEVCGLKEPQDEARPSRFPCSQS